MSPELLEEMKDLNAWGHRYGWKVTHDGEWWVLRRIKTDGTSSLRYDTAGEVEAFLDGYKRAVSDHA